MEGSQEVSAETLLQISQQLDRPAIIIQIWPESLISDIYGLSKTHEGANETTLYFPAMDSLRSKVSCYGRPAKTLPECTKLPVKFHFDFGKLKDKEPFWLECEFPSFAS